MMPVSLMMFHTEQPHIEVKTLLQIGSRYDEMVDGFEFHN